MSAPPAAQGSAPVTEPEDRPEAAPAAATAPRSRTALALLLTVLVAALSSLSLPLLPLLQTTTTVTWPAPGTAVESTMLTLLPYRPLELHATVPCAPATPPRGGLLLATSPAEGPGAGRGLLVRRLGNDVVVSSEGRTLWSGAAPPACALRVDAVGDRTTVTLRGEVVADVVVDPPPVSALATGLPAGTPGLTAELATDSRYETSPTALKRGALVVAALAALGCLLLLAWYDRPRPAVPRTRTRWPWPQDLTLLVVLAFWAVAGPMLSDDGFNVAVADGFADTGTVGNRYRWYNAPETPFALVQQAMVPLLELGRSPLLLRLPAVVAAVLTWLLLSRSLLPRLAAGRHVRAAQWLGLLAFLAWWMPYDLGIRPEPFVALAATAVLVLVLRATESRRLLPLALGGVVAGLAFACAPSGLLAAAPYVVLLPLLLPLLRVPAVPRVLVAAGVLTPGVVTVTVAVFADTGLAALLESTRVHQVIGPTFAWWEEAQRYWILFTETDMGVFARRLPVLLAVGALVLLVATRRRSSSPRPDVLTVAALCVAVSFAVLVLTPSKWTHHFGGFAGYGAVLLAGTALQARERLRREAYAGVVAAAAVAAVVLVAAGFAGPNLWVYYSSFGVSPALPAPLRSPLVWALVVGTAVAVVHLVRTRALPGVRATGDLAAAVPGTALVLGLASSVLIMLATFAVSTARLDGSWSMAQENLGHLTSSSCGMADHVEVLRPRALTVGSGSERQSSPAAFRRGGAFQPAPGNLPAEARRWGSLRPSGAREAATGTLTSAWFSVPDLPSGAELGIAVSGTTAGGNSVVVEYAGRAAPEKVLLRQVVGEPTSDGVDWRYVTFGQGGPGPAADLVRVVLTDRTTGAGGWLAASQPLLMTPSLLRDVLVPGRTSIDYAVSVAYPCADLVPVAHGLARLPLHGVTAEVDRTSGDTRTLQHEEDQGGTLTLAQDTAYLTVLPTRLVGQLRQDELLGRGWGTLVRYDFPHPAGRYAVTTRKDVRSAVRWGYRFPVPLERDPFVPLRPEDPFDPYDGFDKG